MFIFHAIGEADIVPIFYGKTGIRLNILIAYNYIKGQSFKLTDLYRDRINLLYLDSGAFVASKGKSNINVYGYRDHLSRYGHKYDACFNLDDRFDDPAHNLQNQQYLESGLVGKTTVPIPVIHDKKDPFKEFELYAGLGHQYIAIGSSGSRASKDKLLGQAKTEYPDVKVHLFGDLDKSLLEKHRPYSADSATWALKSGRYDGISYWRPSENKQYEYHVGSRDESKVGPHIKRSKLWEEIRAFIHDTFGYEERDLFKFEVRFILNLYFYWQFENYLNSLDAE